MKQPISLLALAALALSGAASLAQTQYQAPSQTQVTPPAATSTDPAAPSATTPASPTATTPSSSTTAPSTSTPATTSAAPAPAPQVVETKVDLTTEPGPPADMRAAREEAKHALHWAKTEGCRSDPSPRDCVRQAQAEHDRVLAQLGGGSVSGAGTSMAGRRGDRN